MKKRLFVFVLLVLFCAGALFAQNNSAKNWISGEVGLPGFGVRYERMLTDKFSVGAVAYWNSFFILMNSFGTQAAGRFYPWAGKFFVELGLGYGNTSVINIGSSAYGINGFAVSPGIGWKIDVGQPGKFFISPVISLPITLGVDSDGEFNPLVAPKAVFGIGYAF